MRLVQMSSSQVMVSPTGISSDWPINVEIEKDRIIVTSRSFSLTGTTASFARPGFTFMSIGSISGGTVFCGNGYNNTLIIDGVPQVIGSKQEPAEDDKYKRRWDMAVPIFDSVQVDSSGILDLYPGVLSGRDLRLNLQGSGDINFKAKGTFGMLSISLLGSGDIDLGGSDVNVASFSLMGSGDIDGCTITGRGSLSIMGSGDIHCRKTAEAQVLKSCMGSGKVKILA